MFRARGNVRISLNFMTLEGIRELCREKLDSRKLVFACLPDDSQQVEYKLQTSSPTKMSGAWMQNCSLMIVHA